VTFGELSERPGDCIECYRSEKLKKPLEWKTIRRLSADLDYAA